MGAFRRASLRFGLWVVFLVLVALATGLAHLGAWVILGVMFAAWVCVAFVELAVSRHAASARSAPRPLSEPLLPELEHVRVLRPEPEPGIAAARVEPEPEPEPPLEQIPEEPVLEAVPEPEPEPEPEPVRSLEPEVVPLPVPAGPPREWNLWSLEQLVRARSTGDAARDEERSYLLMHLREFANADGLLPTDFDALVRESFGDLIAAGGGR